MSSSASLSIIPTIVGECDAPSPGGCVAPAPICVTSPVPSAFHRTVVRLPGYTFGGRENVLTVMQFNVLNPHLEPLPVNTSLEAVAAVKFENRGPLNVAHIAALKPMVLVMEEVDDPARFYGPRLAELGYNFIYERKASGTGDCTCIFYLSSVLRVVGSHKTVFFGTDAKPAGQFALMCRFAYVDSVSAAAAADGASLDGSGVDLAATAVFQHQDFIVAAQHAKAGRTDENEAIRLSHARRLVRRELPAFIQETAEGDEHVASLLSHRTLYVGDFNAGPHTYGHKYPCKVIPWLTKSAARAKIDMQDDESIGGGDAVSRGVLFESAAANGIHNAVSSPTDIRQAAAMAHANDDGHTTPDTDLQFTTCKLRDGKLITQTIDYILYPRGSARTVGWLPCPTGQPEVDLAPLFLPSQVWGSDHLSVYCEVEWLK